MLTSELIVLDIGNIFGLVFLPLLDLSTCITEGNIRLPSQGPNVVDNMLSFISIYNYQQQRTLQTQEMTTTHDEDHSIQCMHEVREL